jgi:hypothetical protein
VKEDGLGDERPGFRAVAAKQAPARRRDDPLVAAGDVDLREQEVAGFSPDGSRDLHVAASARVCDRRPHD